MTISQSLAHELSPTESVENSNASVNSGQKRWQNPILYGFMMIIFGLILTTFGKLILADKTIADIGIILAFLGIGLFGLKVLLTMLPPTRRLSPTKQTPVSPPLTTNPLTALPPQPASVTEHTTRTLEPARKEVLKRFLALNHERATEEAARAAAAKPVKKTLRNKSAGDGSESAEPLFDKL